jgi:hypothetical protein
MRDNLNAVLCFAPRYRHSSQRWLMIRDVTDPTAHRDWWHTGPHSPQAEPDRVAQGSLAVSVPAAPDLCHGSCFSSCLLEGDSVTLWHGVGRPKLTLNKTGRSGNGGAPQAGPGVSA